MRYLFFISLLFIIACDKDEPIDCCTDEPMTEIDPCGLTLESKDIELHKSASTSFAYTMFQETVKQNEGNIIQSPVSIYSAMLMLYEGTACETKAQISRSMNLGDATENFPDLALSYSDYINWLNPESEDFSMSISNAVFSDPERISLKETFTNRLSDAYNAEINELDFSDNASTSIINQWASDNTQGKITQVLDNITAEDVAFLMNALYFNADWEYGFIEDFTFPSTFYRSDGETETVDMMHSDEEASFYQGESIKMIELPLKGNKYIVSVFLPSDENVHIDEIILSEDFANVYSNAVEMTQFGRVILSMPKFELKGKQSLKAPLFEMGIRNAFDQGLADLSMMGESSGQLYITKVLHDVYFKLDESGVEGAAVTTVGVGVTSDPPALGTLNLNRPFAIVVRRADSINPLFIGKIENPLE